eukprot:Platyproteum_vivax@DN443_c0_g1_i2.p1
MMKLVDNVQLSNINDKQPLKQNVSQPSKGSLKRPLADISNNQSFKLENPLSKGPRQLSKAQSFDAAATEKKNLKRKAAQIVELGNPNKVQKTCPSAPPHLSAVDEPYRYNAVYAAPYVDQIMRHMRTCESLYMVPPNFLDTHSHIKPRMRSILVDWMVEVHHRFKLAQETLFLAVNYLDRFLHAKEIQRNKYRFFMP